MNSVWRSLLVAGSVIVFFLATAGAAEPVSDTVTYPEKGIVTMIDLGSKKCIPCKMMAPILSKLEKMYQGKAAIVFIDVKSDTEQAKQFKIRAIPTQIFFDKNGKEVFRHVGFWDEKSIVSQLTKMGVPAPDNSTNG